MEEWAIARVTQRARGVYLASVSVEDADTEWDAFPTEAKAKRWCAKTLDRHRLPWVSASKPGYYPAWVAYLGAMAEDTRVNH